MKNTIIFKQLATRSALLLSLGLSLGACDKTLDVVPQNSVDAATGFATRQDVEAGLVGCYDALQSVNYDGLSYPSFADLISGNIRHTGTFPTYAQIAQNQILTDNVDISNTWNSIYAAINRTNFLIEEASKLKDPAYNSVAAVAQARAMRAYHYMNLLGFWGGSPDGYGSSSGLGVPLRLTPTKEVGESTKPIARSSEAEVISAIREDLDFAAANLSNGSGPRITKGAALALRARLELRVKNYADALKFANQVAAAANNGAADGNINSNDNIWQVVFNNTDQSSFAFYWFPSANGGRNELSPSNELATAHPAGDLRLPINVVTASNATATFPAGTTRKYSRIATRDDPYTVVRYAEMVLTIAEAAARTGNLDLAKTQLNLIRVKAGLAASTATTQAALITDILLQRRLELAHEGHYWFDLRRTNTVQTAIPAYAQTFRNLWPIPQRETLNSGGLVDQNPGY